MYRLNSSGPILDPWGTDMTAGTDSTDSVVKESNQQIESHAPDSNPPYQGLNKLWRTVSKAAVRLVSSPRWSTININNKDNNNEEGENVISDWSTKCADFYFIYFILVPY